MFSCYEKKVVPEGLDFFLKNEKNLKVEIKFDSITVGNVDKAINFTQLLCEKLMKLFTNSCFTDDKMDRDIKAYSSRS